MPFANGDIRQLFLTESLWKPKTTSQFYSGCPNLRAKARRKTKTKKTKMSRCEFIVPTFSQAVGLPLPSHGRSFKAMAGDLRLERAAIYSPLVTPAPPTVTTNKTA